MPDNGRALRVALVRARYNPYGGAERFAARALHALSARGVDVSVIARRWDGAAAPGTTWLRCDPFYLGSVWRERSFARAVVQQVAGAGFDLVQSHERIPGLPVYRAGDGVHAAWLERRAVGMTRGQRLALRLNPYHRYMVATERAMFEHSGLRAVICNSSLVRDEIASRFAIDPARLHVIANGIDLTRYTPAAARAQRAVLRQQLGIDAAAPVFLFVGSGFARKGVATALAALARLDVPAHLVVVGADKHLARYREQARGLGLGARVAFVGPQRDVLPWYGMADALLLPTVYDPFPNVTLEAWACGLPVLTSSGCGAREAVIEGRNGWVREAGDVAGFAAALAALLAALRHDPEALHASARATAAMYSLDALGERLLALYRTLLPDDVLF